MLLVVVLVLLIILGVFVWHHGQSQNNSEQTSSNQMSIYSQEKGVKTGNQEGQLRTVSYFVTYSGNAYEKEAIVYVPASYSDTKPMNILYLMHGSGGSGEILAKDLQPRLDQWISSGKMQPMLVVFPTYYPDSSYVVSDYTKDYPLNHFFATEEVRKLIRTVEGKFRTYADDTDSDGLENSRMHRAFGGYSMGGVTTWDVLAYQAPYFGYYMPMAGDCWLDRVIDVSSDKDTADLLLQGLKNGGYSSEEFRIIAMVGGSDGTKYSMQPQIEALRQTGLITDENLIYWENEGGGHNLESLEKEVEHGISYLWTWK